MIFFPLIGKPFIGSIHRLVIPNRNFLVNENFSWDHFCEYSIMNEAPPNEEDIFKNPEYKPLEELKLTIRQDGVTQTVPALDKQWSQERYFFHYECPHLVDSEGRDIIGAKERWIEVTSFIIDDLTWLLQLPFYRFWSTVIHNRIVVDAMIIFLQDAPVYYSLESFPNDPDMLDQLNRLRHNVLVLFARIITSEESPTEYISPKYHASLIYNKYLVSVPILMDLCQHYGRDNRKIVEKIVNTAFTIQPLYEKDTEKAATFLVEQALGNVEKKFEDYPSNQEGAILLSERGGAKTEMSLPDLEDMILYTLDIVSNISIFLSIHPQSVKSFKSDTLFIKFVSFYGVTIPEMYKKLDDLAYKDETIGKYMELMHRLDVTRVEFLTVYRTVVYKGIKDILDDGVPCSATELDEIIDDFCINLEFALAEKAFVIDFFNMYPVTEDFQTLIELHPDLNSVRFDYILESVFSNFEGEKAPPSSSSSVREKKAPESTPGPSGIEVSQPSTSHNFNGLSDTSKTNQKSDIEIMSLISEVKDVLCDLGEGFIEKCLKHYNYCKESVINAVFEGSLPPELESLDRTLPRIPPDPEEASAEVDAAIGIQRLNIYDNDEFDVMTKDVIDLSRVHKGKRKDKYKNANELLNDKSHLTATKDLYNKYSIVTSEYDDEYDDTYDDQDIGSSAQDDCVEVDARPFTIPRILRKQESNDFDEGEDELESNAATETPVSADQFVQDPELLRARAEERQWSKRGGRCFYARNKDVVGNAKGQGQSKEVVDNRNQKGKNKATRANHNRRAGSQWKRSHGMVPS